MNFSFKKLLLFLLIFILLFSIGLPANFADAEHFPRHRSSSPTTPAPTSPPSTGGPAAGTAGADIISAPETLRGGATCGWNPFTLGCAQSMASGVLTFIGTILGWVADLFDFIIAQTITSGNYNTNQPIIATGWFIVRDLANILIVLSILAIAVGTILQVEGYMIKKTLPRLLIAGLLVNFSLAISGVFVDLGNILAFSFWEGAKGPSGSISEVLIRGFNIPNLLLSGPGAQAIDILIATIFGVIFMGIFAFLLLAFIFMFVGRMIGLWIILLLSPAAFVAMAVPGLSGYASKWWDALIKQSMYAPAALLLVFIVSKVIQDGLTETLFTQQAGLSGSAFINNPFMILNYIALMGILLYSLKLAQDLGGQTAALGTKYIGKLGGYTKKALWSNAAATRLRQRAVGRGLQTVATNRLGQSVLRGTSFLGTGAAVQSRITQGETARRYRMQTDAETLKGRSVNDQARMLGGMSQSAQILAIKNMDASNREKVLKELKGNHSSTYTRISDNLMTTLRADEKIEKAGGVKKFEGLDTGDIAKALAPNDLERALQFKNDKWQKTDATSAALSIADKSEAQRDINDLINGMPAKSRGNLLVNLGSKDGAMGGYFREYFKANGEIGDMMATRKTVNGGEQMLRKIFEDTLGGPLTVSKREFETAMNGRKADIKARLKAINDGLQNNDKNKLSDDKLAEKIEKEFLKEKRKVMGDMFGKVFKEGGGEKLEKEMQRMESILFEPANVTPNREKE